MRYNHHFQNHFGSCTLLATAHDPYRDREVQLRLIPGEFEVVGVTDGTDCWVAPTVNDPFSVGIARILEDVKAGTFRYKGAPQPPHRHTIPAAVVNQIKTAGLTLRKR